jgi:serine/threonine protein kinase
MQGQSHLRSHSDSEKALEAWKHSFGQPQLQLVSSDPSPFVAGRRLGGGGVGIVYETHLNGFSLALKRSYTQRLGERDLNEIKILGRLSGRRHEHIVQLIGSYIHRQRNGYEIGLLISPVADCDLACFMLNMDILSMAVQQRSDPDDIDSQDEVQSAAELLSVFWKDSQNSGQVQDSAQDSESLYKASQQLLCRSFLCVSSAVEFLHRNKIRHKDLKPSQILLSPNGLWLADFGYANDMSACSNSASSNWDTMTYRYQAPERASHGSCSRPEDIFALGCTFLEMSIRLTNCASKTVDSWSYDTGQKWSFQENLVEIESWVASLRTTEDIRVRCLADLICQMMNEDPKCRPTVDQVIGSLSQQSFAEDAPSCSFGSFSNPCCSSMKGVYKRSEFSLNIVNSILADFVCRKWWFKHGKRV